MSCFANDRASGRSLLYAFGTAACGSGGAIVKVRNRVSRLAGLLVVCGLAVACGDDGGTGRGDTGQVDNGNGGSGGNGTSGPGFEKPGVGRDEVGWKMQPGDAKGGKGDGKDRENEGKMANRCERWIKADVVALDQVYTYNRFGSFNPAGMIYALKHDVVAIDGNQPGPGNARLREDKRPRPLVLRANVGDCLEVEFTNWLARNRNEIPEAPDVPFHVEDPNDGRDDSPFTRDASFHVNGLEYLNIESDAANVGRNPNSLAKPGERRTYKFLATREGTYLAYSMGATAGGEGDGGSLVHGLFAAVNVEPRGTEWFRSQVTAEQLAKATKGRNPDGTPIIDYDARDEHGKPILRILDRNREIVHSDLTAIIEGVKESEFADTITPNRKRFREITILFHDEIKAVQAFPELEPGQPLEAVRDAFGINLGASGFGAMLLSNRARVGPSADCKECFFEEFFLTSWANGDPALNVEHDGEGKAIRALYPDDPSNVWHSYLGDPVVMRNIHAGPAETHVFHQHAHQWLQAPAENNGAYLDSQTISPGSAFTYHIAFEGSGNRNLTPGDAIFHCHLYPHFATGMWGLWRVHDAFEAGTPDRNLPDGEIKDGTPTPALVPLPKTGMAPMPTYVSSKVETKHGGKEWRKAFPGYPHYIAAIAGHRPPQPPLDLVFDGGLPRHVIAEVDEAIFGVRGRFDVQLEKIQLKLLPDDGTPPERAAMDFHAGRFPEGRDVETEFDFPAAAYKAYTPEGKKSKFIVNGQPPKPGGPYADPCPQGTKERDLRVAFIAVDLVANTEGWHDPQGRIQVHEEDVEATISGRRPPEPLVMRANSGECVVVESTNLAPDALEEDDFQIFTPIDTLGQHVHLVKFDVTSSDGAANGFNYEDGTFAAESVQDRIVAANAAGGAFAADGTLKPQGRRKVLQPKPHPRISFAPLGTQTTVQRWWADPIETPVGEIDRAITSAFTHDHFAPSSQQQHGMYAVLSVQPAGSKWRNPFTGEMLGVRDDGGPTSLQADILTADEDKSYRELMIALADFALLYDRWGDPINPPNRELEPLPIAIGHEDVRRPEAISANDPGGMVVNYRNEPIPLRIARKDGDRFVLRDGPEGRMENVFRSDIHGDPFTTQYQAYPGDLVEVRMIEGAQEEMHIFTINGRKWLREPDDPDSGWVAFQQIGISEHFEARFTMPPVASDRDVADYMYKGSSTDNLWNGTWGLLRSFRKEQQHLKPLPNNKNFEKKQVALPSCPPQAKVREYTVHAVTAKDLLPERKLVYNEKFDLFDPDAILFARAEHLAELKKGMRKPDTLVLRAAAGECVRVTLINDLPNADLQKTPHWNFLPPITDKFNQNQVPISNHISLHPHLVQYDITRDDGANVGLNPVQTVPPGDRRTYEWYAGEFTAKRVKYDERVCNEANVLTDDGDRTMLVFEATPIEFGAINLRSYADVVNHGTHGAIGSLIIEPEGAEWFEDPQLQAQATVQFMDPEQGWVSFREMAPVFMNEIALHSNRREFQCQRADLNCGTALLPYDSADDSEESGHKGFNHRTEPFWAREGIPPDNARVELNNRDLSDILDSDEHGDPETPIFTARAGDELRIRIHVPSGHPRMQAYTLHGHGWDWNPYEQGTGSTRQGPDPDSFQIGTIGGLGAASMWNANPLFGAGGRFRVHGDFLYREQGSFMFPDGMWGIFRVQR